MKAMRRFICILSLALCVATHAVQFKIGAHNFTLPDGFEIELVAGTNLVPRPIEADFDEQGRLYVTDSSGSNDKPDKQLIEKPHRIVRLEDTDGDGKFDKSIVFADKMSFLEGCMWLDGSLYVAAPPSIWKLTDTNNDGIADVRVEWFQGKTLTGCANDLHGPYAGPDGWIYWCKGAFAKQTYTLPNGKEFTTRASHIFRARPDGSGVEPIMTGGMDNPVGLAWSPEGELFLSGTFFQHPAGGKRDGLIHVLYGGVYGKDHDVLDGHPRTGDLLPMMTHLGAAAPCGLARYESDVFGKKFQNNLFVCCFNMHKIVRCVLEPTGATYKTTDSDFLVSDNTDFHPTDVLEDADGSLIIVDTGGWYKLCCPTSQLYKPDVLGGIYRVRRKSVPRITDPRGLKIDWAKATPNELINLLSDARPRVAVRAVSLLGNADEATVRLLASTRFASPVALQNSRWALARNSSPAARKALIELTKKSGDNAAWRIATHAIGLNRESRASELLINLLGGYPATCRAAAEALGRIGDSAAVPALLKQTIRTSDRSLEHSVIYALIEIGDAEKTKQGLTSRNPFTTRAALRALDQMPNANLEAGPVVPLLKSKDAELKKAAVEIISHHPEWGTVVAEFFAPLLRQTEMKAAEQAELVTELSALSHVPTVQTMMGATLDDYKAGDLGWFIVMKAMGSSGLSQTPKSWSDALAKLLWSDNTAVVSAGVNAVKSLPSKGRSDELDQRLLYVASKGFPAEVRLNALAAMSHGLPQTDSSTFDFLRSRVQATNTVAVRGAASGILAKARLSESQLLSLANDLNTAGPIELPKLLGAFARSTNETVGVALVSALEKSKSLSSLRAETLKPVLTNFPSSVQQKAEALLASLNTDSAQQKAHIDEMLASVKGGDVRRGQAIFNSPKAACSACHAIGYLGGKVGPDLTKIGTIRNERDLLEAIVYPSASFVRSYEPMIVSTKSGEEFSGILKKDSAEEIVLATGPNTEQRIARNDVADLRPGSVSVMPSGLAEQLTKEELADLLAFLKATKW